MLETVEVKNNFGEELTQLTSLFTYGPNRESTRQELSTEYADFFIRTFRIVRTVLTDERRLGGDMTAIYLFLHNIAYPGKEHFLAPYCTQERQRITQELVKILALPHQMSENESRLGILALELGIKLEELKNQDFQKVPTLTTDALKK